MSNSRKGYIRKVLPDGSIEEIVVDLPDKKTDTSTPSKPKKKTKKVKKEEVLDDKDNQKQEEKSVGKTNQATISITRPEV
jgi:hypothetical protein